MGIKIREFGTVIASFATPQEIVVDHANDSIRLGDGTDLITSTLAGGKQCLDVRPYGAGDASAANQTSGDQLTQLTDSLKTDVAEIDTIGAEKALKVSVIATVGGGTTPAATDDAAFAVATDSGVMIMGLADETAPDSVDEGDAGALRMTLDRLLKIQLAGVATGVAVPVTDNGGALTVDGTVAVTNANLDAALSTLATAANQATIIGHVDGIEGLLTTIDADTGNLAAMLTSLQLIDDAVHSEDVASANADAGMGMLAVRKATPANTSGTDGDYEFLQMSAGRLWVSAVLDTAIPAGTNNIGDVDVLSLPAIPAGTNNIGDVDIASIAAGDNNIGNVDIVTMPDVTCVGKAAHDAAISGNPVRIGARAYNTSITSVAADDTVDLIADKQGSLIVTPVKPREFIRTQVTNITNTTETTIVTAGGAGVFNDIVGMIITNNSDVQATCTIKDSTAGTTRLKFLVPARGGVVFQPCTPLAQQAAANNNWTATMGTTATATDISVVYVINT